MNQLPPIEVIRTLSSGKVLVRCSRCSLITEVSEKNIECRACDKPVKKRTLH